MNIESPLIKCLLTQLEEAAPLLRQDYRDIVRFTDGDALVNRSTASRAVRSRLADWCTFAFLVHGKGPHEHMQEQGFRLPDMDASALERFSRLMQKAYFRRSRPVLETLASDPENGVISMWFSCLHPGAKIGLHVNNDPYMYRSHIGISIPEGNVGLKVGDEHMKWKEGKALVFDPTIPHTAWNLTDAPRVVFIVDFFRPNEDREQMRALEREQFRRMMRTNPLSFGMSGGYHDLDEETFQRYAIPEIG
jgi:hypothetical protein